MAELVTGISHGKRRGILGHRVAGEDRNTFWRFQTLGIEPEVARKSFIELDELGRLLRRWQRAREEAVRQACVAVVEGERGRFAHPLSFAIFPA